MHSDIMAQTENSSCRPYLAGCSLNQITELFSHLKLPLMTGISKRDSYGHTVSDRIRFASQLSSAKPELIRLLSAVRQFTLERTSDICLPGISFR